MKIREIIEWKIMPQTARPMGLRKVGNHYEPINWGNNRGNEDAAGVGIITKQNTTADVKPGETERNLKKLHLTNSVNKIAPMVNYGIGSNPGKLVPVGKDGRVPHAKLHVNVSKDTAKKLGIPREIEENFTDGKGPGRAGDSKRAGIPKGATITQLKRIRSSKTASARKKQLAHWQINMRQGRKK